MVSKPFQGEPLELTIEKTLYNNMGLAKSSDGQTILVEKAISGDYVRCQVTAKHTSYQQAKIVEFIEKNPKRKEASCRFYPTCGGCQWQDVKYTEQISFKKSFISDALTRIAKIPYPESAFEIWQGEDDYYRNRVLFRCEAKKDKTIGIGFFEEGSHNQVHISHCKITAQSINELLSAFSKARFEVPPQKFRMEWQILPYYEERELAHILITLFPLDKGLSLTPIKDWLLNQPSVRWVGNFAETKAAPIFPFETDKGILYQTKPAHFQQVNIKGNHALRERILSFCEEKNISQVLDLYCGSGNLSLQLIKKGISVIGVEQSQGAIEIAQDNLKKNNLKDGTYLAEDGEKYMRRKDLPRFDLVIIDPPRRGIKEVVPSILALKPQYIAYVSCDPTTLARDIGALKTDYHLGKVFAFDFFPQTYHIETVCFLEKNKAKDPTLMR